MAGTIQLGDMGEYVNQQMEKLLRVVVLDVDARLKMESPVKTGRFRASWQVGENSATGGIVPDGSYPSAPPLTRIGYSWEKLGNIYSVHNNLPYAEKLALGQVGSGGSIQTGGPGWVQAIAKDAQSYAKAQAAKIGRES
jgi:hypothetical protein